MFTTTQNTEEYYPTGNFTQIPNSLLEAILLAFNTVYELKLAFALVRCILGWGRVAKVVTYAQLQAMTGIHDNRNIAHVLKILEEKDYISIESYGMGKGVVYRINLAFGADDPDMPCQVLYPDTKLPSNALCWNTKHIIDTPHS